MGEDSPTPLLKGLTRETAKPSYLLWGSGTALLEESLAWMANLIVDEDDRAFNSDVFHGPGLDCSSVVTSAAMAPLMTRRRLVVVKGFDPKKAANTESLVSYLQSPCSTTCLIVAWHPHADPPAGKSRSRAGKKAKAAGKGAVSWPALFSVVVNLELKKQERVRWVQARAASLGLKLDQRSVALVLDLLGDDLNRIGSELEKIALCQQGPLGEEWLTRHFKDTRQRREWELRQAIWDRDQAAVLKTMEKLLEEGLQPVYIVSVLCSALNAVLIGRAALAQGSRPADAAARAGVVSFKQAEFARMLKGLDGDKAAQALVDLARVDLQLKGTSVNPRFALEIWVCSQAGYFRTGKKPGEAARSR